VGVGPERNGDIALASPREKRRGRVDFLHRLAQSARIEFDGHIGFGNAIERRLRQLQEKRIRDAMAELFGQVQVSDDIVKTGVGHLRHEPEIGFPSSRQIGTVPLCGFFFVVKSPIMNVMNGAKDKIERLRGQPVA